MKIDTPDLYNCLPASFPNRLMSLELLERAIDLALLEDLGQPAIDLTSEALIESESAAVGNIYCLTNGAVIAGLPLIKPVFNRFDPDFIWEPMFKEGELVNNTPVSIARLKGEARAIIIAERVALNLLQRMCAVATTTHRFAEKAKKSNIAILDTRKTMPGLRIFEKYAVSAGGGQNHRFGLYDAILVKDNHLKASGGVTKAVEILRAKYADKKLEIECTNLSEVQECLSQSVEKILLDNMSPERVKEAVKLIDGRAFIEVSGGVNITNIEGYLLPGVNAISIGALTHSAIPVDLSLELED